MHCLLWVFGARGMSVQRADAVFLPLYQMVAYHSVTVYSLWCSLYWRTFARAYWAKHDVAGTCAYEMHWLSLVFQLHVHGVSVQCAVIRVFSSTLDGRISRCFGIIVVILAICPHFASSWCTKDEHVHAAGPRTSGGFDRRLGEAKAQPLDGQTHTSSEWNPRLLEALIVGLSRLKRNVWLVKPTPQVNKWNRDFWRL